MKTFKNVYMSTIQAPRAFRILSMMGRSQQQHPPLSAVDVASERDVHSSRTARSK